MSLRRKNSWYLEIGIFCYIIFLLSLTSALRINEVELNPAGTDAGKEWIELFSESEVDINLLSIRNYDNQTINLSSLNLGNFSGFLKINLTGQWLDNSDEKVFLIFNNSIIDETSLLSDSSNDNRTWQYCNEWKFKGGTENKENDCEEPIIESNTSNNQEEIEENSTENEEDEDNKNTESTITSNVIKQETENKEVSEEAEIIKLNNPQNIKSQEIWKSKTQYIKEYSIYGFAVFCVFVIILLVIKNKPLEKISRKLIENDR